jgi:WhiB family transcriptional regulator, redox-sensing transcriptional regulator
MEPALARPRSVAIDHDDLLVHDWRVTQRLTDDALSARVAGQARCADSGLDPDQWYPVSVEAARARREAAAAIAVCTGCPVRAQCLELSLRHWDVGKHGVWGGLVATDRAHLRRQFRWAWGRAGDAQ